jgi:hypothetical protein
MESHVYYHYSVQSSSEKAAKDLFQMYEAVKDEEGSKQAKQVVYLVITIIFLTLKVRLFVDDDIEDPDDIMCNFIPMVKEYLTRKNKTSNTYASKLNQPIDSSTGKGRRQRRRLCL